MIENQALLSAILADPDDDRPRLVYADWLEQHGQLDRARLIRVQIELARLPDVTAQRYWAKGVVGQRRFW